MKYSIGKLLTASLIAITLLVGSVYIVPAAVQGVMGLAVAQSARQYNDVKDYVAGDTITKGVLDAGCMFWNGSSADRCRGSITNGLLVDVTRVPTSGTAFFSVKRENIAAASVNLAFGFTSKKISIRAPLTNTDEVCIDYIGGTAVCPAANTAGDSRIAPGGSILLDDYAQTSVSVISASGTQTVYIDAWN
jgi:hypothetical protein